MSINISRYVNVNSSVGAGANVGNRQLIGRFFDDNAYIPTGGFVQFTSFQAVSDYFGSSSMEAARAALWFGWTSKNGTGAQALSFARWNAAASAPQIFGAKQAQALASWTSITSGAFNLIIAGTTNALTAMNFSTAIDLAGVAAIIQTKIRTLSGAMYTSATVTYDATRGSFNFTGGTVGAATISVTAGPGGSDIAGQLGWLSATAIFSNGAPVQTITDVLTNSAAADNNFGSFTFTATLTQAQIVEAATWNDTQNNMFLYSARVTSATAAAISAATIGLSGITLTLAPLSTEYPEQAPMMILSSTDYTGTNTTQNYMFQQFALTPSVSTDTDANTYDALRVNYYGQTQTAGQQLSFYQQGVMMGLDSDPLFQNIYANEIWLKDACTAALMTALLSLNKISANAAGRAKIINVLQGVVNQALTNGTISVAKTLTAVQKLYITNGTGDPDAWIQVQNQGYWLNVRIVSYVESNITKYKAVYTLYYSKDDTINKIEGSDILI